MCGIDLYDDEVDERRVSAPSEPFPGRIFAPNILALFILLLRTIPGTIIHVHVPDTLREL